MTLLTVFTLFLSHQDIYAGDQLNVFRSMIRMYGWIVGFYYICKIGDGVTNRFQNIAHSIYDCPWHEMPLKMTKHIPMLIAIAQQPIFLYGSFNIRCIRETFQKVRGKYNEKKNFSHTFAHKNRLFGF